MKLLITTQAVDVNDPILGFFCDWIIEFAKQCEQVEVICLREGKHDLPANVRVRALGPGDKATRAFHFWSLLRQLNGEYDAVFVHMNPEYAILGGPFWRAQKIPVGLWYLHKAVNIRLRFGVLFANVVFTASQGSMRLVTSKKRVVGHGLDLDAISLVPPPSSDEPLQLLTIGRLSPVKRVDLLIDALAELHRRGKNARLTIVGGPASKEDEVYARALRARAANLGVADFVTFRGSVPHAALTDALRAAHLFLHASATGSLDKASLEPLAAGVPIVTVNQELADAGMRSIIGVEANPKAIADAVERAVDQRLWADVSLRAESRRFVEEHYSLPALVKRILGILYS